MLSPLSENCAYEFGNSFKIYPQFYSKHDNAKARHIQTRSVGNEAVIKMWFHKSKIIHSDHEKYCGVDSISYQLASIRVLLIKKFFFKKHEIKVKRVPARRAGVSLGVALKTTKEESEGEGGR